MFVKLTVEGNEGREKVLNLDRICCIELYESGGSTVHFGRDYAVRLSADENQVLGSAIAKAKQVIATQ